MAPPTPHIPHGSPPADRSDRGRVACVLVPALPLQVLLGKRPEWSGRPVAVVDRDQPQGEVLRANERARRARVAPGMRYAAALSLCRGLCADEVSADEVGEEVERLTELLRDFSPHVEPGEEPGAFWLDASGLRRLEPSLQAWAERIRDRLRGSEDGDGNRDGRAGAMEGDRDGRGRRHGLVARVVVGFSRFGTWAIARALAGGTGPKDEAVDVLVLDDPAEERRLRLRVPLERLELEPDLRDTLARLGIRTLGDFLCLPPEGVGKRFGHDALRLHRRAAGDGVEVLDPELPPDPIRVGVDLEHPETDVTRLLFVVKSRLHGLLERLRSRGEALARLTLRMRLDDGDERIERVAPATPTRATSVVIDLVRLRLEKIQGDLGAGVVGLLVHAEGQRVDAGQRTLFRHEPRRDLDAADRALARVRAELGRNAVVSARLEEAHLPEARFTWEPLEGQGTRFPEPDRPRGPDRPLTLVRRLYNRPRLLPSRQRHEPDGWLIRGLERGPAVRTRGPYVVSGGWWVREVHREYHFVETGRGDILWVFYDRRRRGWFQQGDVE